GVCRGYRIERAHAVRHGQVDRLHRRHGRLRGRGAVGSWASSGATTAGGAIGFSPRFSTAGRVGAGGPGAGAGAGLGAPPAPAPVVFEAPARLVPARAPVLLALAAAALAAFGAALAGAGLGGAGRAVAFALAPMLVVGAVSACDGTGRSSSSSSSASSATST